MFGLINRFGNMAKKLIKGVYMIMSIARPDRIYIGASIDMADRHWNHKWRLKNNNHHSVKLQRHYDKYGEEDLVYVIIEEFDDIKWDELVIIEQRYLDFIDTYFNSSKTAGCPATVGKKQPKWFVEKRMAKIRGKKRKPMTDEHKKNLRESKIKGGKGNGLTGKPKSKETREKIGNTLRGRKKDKDSKK